MTPRRGRLVAFEGGEACGKSTQAQLFAAMLDTPVLTFEPGGTDVGQRIRSIVLDPAVTSLAARAEALLVLADRAQHVAEVLRPALERGVDVVTDRYIGSTLAYQGYGRGLDVDELEQLCDWATESLCPDLVVLLDVPLDVARSRLAGRPDRVEGADRRFHERVAAGFRALAARDASRWAVVDGVGDVDEVAARVLDAARDRIVRR